MSTKITQDERITRFWLRVDKKSEDECWPWVGSRLPKGYGYLHVEGRHKEYAHRFSYRLHYGILDNDKKVCHSCDNPPCVNPKHLWQGTQKDNIQDAQNKGRMYPSGKLYPTKKLLFCNRGHKFEGKNIMYIKDGRRCRACVIKKNKEFYKRRKLLS